MASNVKKPTGDAKSGRFNKLLLNLPFARPLLPSDTVVYRDDSVVVCPTLGSFLPYWYLILPTKQCLNFSDWSKQAADRSIPSEISKVVNKIGGNGKEFIWFEHGASSQGSVTGCGVDYAHIHVILDSTFSTDDILRTSNTLNVIDWHQATLDEIYHARHKNGEYLAFGNSSIGYLKNLTASVGSQYFRRILAILSNNRRDWDYRIHHHQDIAQMSVDRVARKKESDNLE